MLFVFVNRLQKTISLALSCLDSFHKFLLLLLNPLDDALCLPSVLLFILLGSFEEIVARLIYRGLEESSAVRKVRQPFLEHSCLLWLQTGLLISEEIVFGFHQSIFHLVAWKIPWHAERVVSGCGRILGPSTAQENDILFLKHSVVNYAT